MEGNEIATPSQEAMLMSISVCPICGAALQATRMEYLGNVLINGRGDVLTFERTNLGAETVVYCENDHELQEMLRVHHEENDL